MKIKSFHNFRVSERIYEKKDPPEQNTPTKTGIDYRDNMDIPKQDTGDDSAGLYTIFLTQASTVLNSMSTNVAPINPDKGSTAANRIVALIGNIKPTYESHKKLWNEIEKISDYVGGDWKNSSKGQLSSLNAFDPEGVVLDAFKKNMQELKSKQDTKKITDSQYEEEAKQLRMEVNSQLDKSRGLYYMKIGQVLDYYMQAIKVYKQGALLCLQNMESESGENKTTAKKYLDIITDSATNILGKK